MTILKTAARETNKTLEFIRTTLSKFSWYLTTSKGVLAKVHSEASPSSPLGLQMNSVRV